MKPELALKTRREFLQTTVLGGALTWTVPAFLASTISALQAEAAGKPGVTTGRDGRILVVLQMAGGNDGINTVIPFQNDHYRRARPRLALAANQVLKLNDDLGLHPSLAGFKGLYDAGQLSIVQGVGYPNPNRSHFRSTEIWQTASDANRFERHGWLGKYFDNACPGADPTVGVSVGRQMPQAFAAKQPKGISLENPQNYRFISGEKTRLGEAGSTEDFFRKLNSSDEEMMENAGGTIGTLPGTIDPEGSPLDFLERTALDAQFSSDRIREIVSKASNTGEYPASNLANSLRLVARLIEGGLPTRVFYVSQGGYDTHTNQAPAQERLLKDLGDSVKAFLDDLKAQGNQDRVLLMTFSEFGRRVAENASGGTDHGAAAPLFLAGPSVKAGLQGAYPSLAPSDLFQGDIRFTVDFRSVYSTVLEKWLNTSAKGVLGKTYPPLALV